MTPLLKKFFGKPEYKINIIGFAKFHNTILRAIKCEFPSVLDQRGIQIIRGLPALSGKNYTGLSLKHRVIKVFLVF